MSEDVTTLTEEQLRAAQRVLTQRECDIAGHDYDVLLTIANRPTHVICARCGRAWGVETRLGNDEEPA